tara:strand:+ start:11803 stop:12396 length:594 start_codon:yes stop_codon:yes gene_type:complete
MQFSKAEKFLRKSDEKLKKIIDENGHLELIPDTKNQFDKLVGIVISQFISTKASDSIFKNIKNEFSTDYLNENHFQELKISEIKKMGLSQNKARTIKELSELYLNENNLDLTKIDDKKLKEILLSIFGIGPWSVKMFQIFSIGRQDIFSSKDAGLRLAMNDSGMIKPESNWIKYFDYSKKWSPYRSTACLHLWKLVD